MAQRGRKAPAPYTHCERHGGSRSGMAQERKGEGVTASDSIKRAIDRLEYRLLEAEFEASACRTAIECLRDEQRHAQRAEQGVA